MSDLNAVQQQMAGFLRSRRGLEKSAQATAFADLAIGGNERLSPVEQLEIYREQFWLRHTGALLEDFPGLAGILGQAAWERLVEAYLGEVVSGSFTLRDLGSELPAFIERTNLVEHQALCHDMARLEWAYVEAFDAADVAALDASRLGAIPEHAWESARLVLAPSLSLLRCGYRVADLRTRLVKLKEAHVPIPPPEPNCVAVCRQGLKVRTHELSEPQLVLLEQLRAGMTLVPAVESAARILSLSAEVLVPELGAWFAAWAEQGVVIDVLA